MKRIFILLLMLCGAVCAAQHATAETILCNTAADVYIDQGSPADNFNTLTRLLISYHPTKGVARGLWKFNIPGTINAAQIESAMLHVSGSIHTGGGNAISVYCYALNSPFDENAETWNTHSGGDYDTSVFSSGSLPAGNDWEAAIDVTTLAKGNLSKLRDNGMLMRKQQEGPTKEYQNIASRESTDPEDFAAYIEMSLSSDSDGDGIPDAEDNCPAKPNGPNIGTCSATSDKPGINCNTDADCANGCSSNGLCIKDQRDADNDGVGDVCDCAPLDETKFKSWTVYVDADGDGHGAGTAVTICGGATVPDGYSTSNDDGCPNDPLKATPGICGCGVPDTDSEGDGVLDCIDNCPNTPNGPLLGTCMPGSDRAGATCHSDADCVNGCSSKGTCSLNQEDTNGDGVGDVCPIN